MESQMKDAVKASTMCAVNAEVARGVQSDPTGQALAKAYYENIKEALRFPYNDGDPKEARKMLLRLAANALRMADEAYPSDGLEF